MSEALENTDVGAASNPEQGNPPVTEGGNPNDPAGATGAPDDGDKGSSSSDSAGDPFAELDADTRDWIMKRHGNDVAKLAKQARELDRYASKSISVPGENATDEEWSRFYEKLRPESAKEYGFEAPTDLPETVMYDGDRDNRYADAAHNFGLTKKQANGLREWFLNEMVEAGEESKNMLTEQVKGIVDKSKQTLTTEWGPMDGQQFKANVELADRGLSLVDTDGSLREAFRNIGILGPNDEILEASIAKAFKNVGAAFATEDDKVTGQPEFLGNVFDETDPNFNLTRAMQMAHKEPERARQQILAAGGDPSAYGL